MKEKPGYKTTEFWLSLTATVVGFVLASGLLSPADETHAKILQVLGLVASILANLGYTAARAHAKGKATEASALVEIAKATGGAALTRPSEPAPGP